MNNLRGLVGIWRMDRVPNAWIRELCGVERMWNGRIAKGFYLGECAGSRSVGRPPKRWIDTVKDYLRKKGFDVRKQE